jgi:hypothetical protein
MHTLVHTPELKGSVQWVYPIGENLSRGKSKK